MSDFQSINGLMSQLPSNLNPATGQSEMGKDDFLKLLVAQMKVQDPMNPQDATQFTAQIAQFTELEQLTNLNDTMQSGVQADAILAQSINNTLSATIIGKDAKVFGGTMRLTGDDVTSVGFELSTAAQTVTAKIYDSSGNLVRTLEQSDVQVGEGSIDWDGKDEKGNDLLDGQYSVEITSTGYDETERAVQPLLIGRIEAVKYTNEGAVLIVDGVKINFSDVIEIREPADSGTSSPWGPLTWIGG